MNTEALRATLSKGVGKRILLFFLLAAVVPMAFTATLAYTKFSDEVRESNSQELNARAKKYGQDIFTRIEFAASKAAEVDRLLEADMSLEAMSDEFITNGFDAIWTVPTQTAFDHPSRRALGVLSADVDVDFLNEEGTQLILTDDGNLMFLRKVVTANQEFFLVFKLNEAQIWGDRETLSYIGEFCVMSVPGLPLHCTAPIGEDLRNAFSDAALDPAENAFIEFRRQDLDMYAARWHLFLAGTFRGDPLAIVMVQQKDIAMRSGSDFAWMFFPATILMVLLVGILSLSLISRSLTPLGILTRSAGKVAGGDFSTRSNIKTGDEFEKLGGAFDDMAEKLGQQVSTLKAMSTIDRLILSSSDLDQIAEQVVKYLHQVEGCGVAAVVAHDPDVAGMGKMMCAPANGRFQQERIELPPIMNQVLQEDSAAELEVEPAATHPYAKCFVDAGYPYIAVVPVIVQDAVKGLLIVGLRLQHNLSSADQLRCRDLASRFAVALSSVQREETLYRQAHFDVLTGLPNRQLLKDRLEQHISRARNYDEHGAVFFIDLDRFKEVNDVYGHTVGDMLLCQAAERILSTVRKTDTVARLGGDEFVVVVPNYRTDRRIRLTAENLLEKLEESFSIHGVEHFLSGSIGISLFPADGATVETLLRNADAAMYRAKDAGRNRFEFYSRELNAQNQRKVNLERDLRTAVSNAELEVYFQPQMHVSTGRISGAEALVRWSHPVHGAVEPDEFIPLAEDSDLIVDLGTLVLERSCQHLRTLLDEGLHPGVLSINVSGRQLGDSRFERSVLEPMRRWEIHPGFIQLEITETTVAQNRDIASGILSSLQSEGIRIALDDFGTGYSSLSYLENMPFDSLKIDKSFIDRIGTSETSDNICNTIIKMAEQLNKKSIAEGVETGSQVSFLSENGCDYIQGYYFAKPMPFEQFRDFMSAQSFHTQRRRALEIG